MKKRLLFLILNYFAWLPLFIIQKPWFMTYNHPSTGNCSLADGWKVILHGLKLDCTVAGYLTIIPLLMTLLSTWIPGKWYKRDLRIYHNGAIANYSHILGRCRFVFLLGIQDRLHAFLLFTIT